MKFIASFAILLASAGLACAGGAYDSTGVITGQSSAKIHPLGEGHLVMELNSTHDAFAMDAEGHPFVGLSGTCAGGVEIKGPAASGGGVCQYKNATGDAAFVKWTAEGMSAEGAMNGTWVVMGGTGGLANMAGGGHFSTLTDRSSGATRATLTGAVSLP